MGIASKPKVEKRENKCTCKSISTWAQQDAKD